MDIRFYHLTRQSLDEALPQLLETVTARGHRILVHSSDPAEQKHLDTLLWTWRDDSFLPHAVEGGANSEDQNILISASDENTNNADVLVLFDGQDHALSEAMPITLMMFDGRDDEIVAKCRKLWSEYKAREATLTYWQQGAEGGWQKKQ